jgi:hypothetical protein
MYYISLPWRKEFVDTIKAIVPGGKRGYDEVTKQWVFAEEYLKALEILVRGIFGTHDVYVESRSDVEARAKKAAAPAVITAAPLDEVLLKFVKLLSHSAMKRAYLLTLGEVHPDKGGDAERTMSLNVMWDRIEREWFKR